MPTFAARRPVYDRLWASCTIRPEWLKRIGATAKMIEANRARYEVIQRQTGVPWFVVGLIHQMEAGGSFTTHLHNGDSLRRRTVQVPAGRPKADPAAGPGRPYTWEESAIDAIRYDGLDKVKDWSIERIAYELEGYNGWGYLPKGINSPYLWSGTNHYTAGKYVRDGVWSSTAVSGQSGAMAILKRLMQIDTSINPSDLPATGGKHVDDVTPAMVKAIQTELTRLGYQPGGIDGRAGLLTQGAILSFQKDNGLPLTGEASPQLVEQLANGKARVLAPERTEAATVPNEPTKGATSTIETIGKVAVGVGAAGGAVDAADKSGTLDQVADWAGKGQTIATGLKSIITTMGEFWWVFALVVGGVVAYKAIRAKSGILAAFHSGRLR